VLKLLTRMGLASIKLNAVKLQLRCSAFCNCFWFSLWYDKCTGCDVQCEIEMCHISNV